MTSKRAAIAAFLLGVSQARALLCVALVGTVGCAGAPTVAERPPAVTPSTPAVERAVPAVLVRSEQELVATGHSVDVPVDFDSVAVIVIPGMSARAVSVDATSGAITVDRRTGASIAEEEGGPLDGRSTLAMTIGQEEIRIVQRAPVRQDCPPSRFDPPPWMPRGEPFVLPPTLALIVPRSAASLPIRWSLALRTIQPMCPGPFSFLALSRFRL